MRTSEDRHGNKNYTRYLISEISMKDLLEISQKPSKNIAEFDKKMNELREGMRWELNERLGRPYQLPNQEGKSNGNDVPSNDGIDDLPF